MDTGSSFQPLALPKSQVVTVVCPNCKARNTLKNSMKERPSHLEDGVSEAILVCPDCGHVKHVYWMSKELRVKQAEMAAKIKILSRRATQENLNKVIELRENYKNLFDAEQQRFHSLLEIDDGRAA